MIPTWAHELKVRYKARINGTHVVLKVCPYCGNDRWNFEISLTQYVFNCWSCSAGKGKTAKDLLSTLDVDIPKSNNIAPPPPKKEECILPDSRPLQPTAPRGPAELAALQYLRSRGLTNSTITSWGMRLASGRDAEYIGLDCLGYVVVPFYGLAGLEYYVAARFISDTRSRKYLLPDILKDRYVPKCRKSSSLVIVEGLFDGTAVWQHTDCDVMMLFGKRLGAHQRQMLKRAAYHTVYTMLDGDAWAQNLDLTEDLFQGGINVAPVMLPVGLDPDNEKEFLPEHLLASPLIKDPIEIQQLRRRYVHGR